MNHDQAITALSGNIKISVIIKGTNSSIVHLLPNHLQLQPQRFASHRNHVTYCTELRNYGLQYTDLVHLPEYLGFILIYAMTSESVVYCML